MHDTTKGISNLLSHSNLEGTNLESVSTYHRTSRINSAILI